MKRHRPRHGVLFDLDGTLLDTAPDMAGALNELRASEGLPPLPFASLRPHVSHGSARLVSVGFGRDAGDEFERLRLRFLDVYRARLASDTRPFEGMDVVLAMVESAGFAWGVVTNKPGWLTEPLLRELGLDTRCACIVSGDTLPVRKPHPGPLLHAAGALDLAPADCTYVGDAERDIQAGRAAGMRTLVAAFGYLGEDDDPAAWGADGIVSRPLDLPGWLGLERAA
jgi:phosphoglycolate phosphatase